METNNNVPAVGGLTDERIDQLFNESNDEEQGLRYSFARAIEREALATRPSVDLSGLTEKQIAVAGRALADRNADACGVDREDNWKLYGDEFNEDAKVALTALLTTLPAAPVPPFSAAEQPKNSSALAGKFWARIALATTLPEHEISTLAHDLEKIAAAHLARQAQAGAEIRPEVVERFADYSKIAHLIGSIFFAGDFRAETANERDLEALLVKTGHRYASWEEVGLFRADDLPVEFLAAPTQGSAPQAERVVPGSQEK